MTTRRMIRMSILAAAVASLFAALSGTASAATLAPTAGIHMSSTAIIGDDVYWFQRSTSSRRGIPMPPMPIPESSGPPGYTYYYPVNASPGRVLHRKLGSSKVSVVYKPADEMAINGFVARAGRVVVGLTSMDRRPRSSILELVRSGEAWTAKPIVERIGGQVEGRCDARVNLLNVDAESRVAYEDVVVEGQGGKCELIRRQSIYKRVAVDGNVEEFGKSQSGWALEVSDIAERSMRAGPGSWFARESLGGAGLSAYNLESGSSYTAPLMLSDMGRVEVSADGRLLRQAFTASKKRLFLLSRSAENPQDNAILRRSGQVTWFHLCGAKVLEIARSRKPRNRGGGRFWYLYIRNLDGTVERKLPTKLPRHTSFNGCDANQALFSREVRERRVRQISISLVG